MSRCSICNNVTSRIVYKSEAGNVSVCSGCNFLPPKPSRLFNISLIEGDLKYDFRCKRIDHNYQLILEWISKYKQWKYTEYRFKKPKVESHVDFNVYNNTCDMWSSCFIKQHEKNDKRE